MHKEIMKKMERETIRNRNGDPSKKALESVIIWTVQECFRICDEYTNEDESLREPFIVFKEKIKEHFGIE